MTSGPLPPTVIGTRGACRPRGTLRAPRAEAWTPVVVALPLGGSEHQRQDLEGVAQQRHPVAQRRELPAERLVLVALPARPDADLEAAVRDHVKRAGHLREQRRIAVADPGDERTRVARAR